MLRVLSCQKRPKPMKPTRLIIKFGPEDRASSLGSNFSSRPEDHQKVATALLNVNLSPALKKFKFCNHI